VPAEFGLLEHGVSISDDLESSPSRGNHPQLRVRKALTNLSRQTGGSGLVVSNDAIFDADLHGGLLDLPDVH